MTADSDPPALPARIGVCIVMSDPLLAERMASLLSADSGLEVSLHLDDNHDPGVFLADRIGLAAGPSIIIDDGSRIPQAWDADVRAVLPPSVEGELLRAAIRVVSAGFTIAEVDEPGSLPTTAWGIDPSLGADDSEVTLTARETEVLGLLVQGASNKVIARTLDISVHTAKFHVASLMGKLGARNRSDAVAIGIRRGLVML